MATRRRVVSALSLDAAAAIVDAALAHGETLGCRPLTVVVVDAAGHLVAFKHQDGPGFMCGGIAIAKARAAVDGTEIGAPGAVAIVDSGGAVIGGVGVSGHEAHDEAVARAGVVTLGKP